LVFRQSSDGDDFFDWPGEIALLAFAVTLSDFPFICCLGFVNIV
jgi:hypothetical protein